MSLVTSNKFGKIVITKNAIKTIAHLAAKDCYGVVELVSHSFLDDIKYLFGASEFGRGVTVKIVDNIAFVELFVVLKFGVNIEAVKRSLADAVKFSLETFSGMRVKRVHVNVCGIRV